MRKDEICNAYITHKQDILDVIRNKLMRWHTPIHGYTSIEEYESDERYQFLMRSANVKHFFTLLGKMFFTSYGKEFFIYHGKQIFTSQGKHLFTRYGKQTLSSAQPCG